MTLYKLKWFLIKLSIFKHTFHSIEGFVYVDENKKPVNNITDKVKWLGTVDIRCRYKDVDKKAFEAFHNKYPQYRGLINLF